MAVIRSRRYRRSSQVAIRACLDSLETRNLLSTLVTHAAGNFAPALPASDGNGGIYAVDFFAGGIDHGTLDSSGNLTLTALGNDAALHTFNAVASSPDGTLWGATSDGTLLHFDASGNQIGPAFVPNAGTQFINNGDIFTSLTVPSNGVVWFTSSGTGTASGGNQNTQAGEIGRFDLSNGQFAFASLPTGTTPQFLAAAPDGTVWTTTQYFFENSTTNTFSITSGVTQASWDGSSVNLANFNVADSANQLSNPVVIPANDGNPGDYTLWFTSSVVQYVNSAITYPDVSGQLDHVVVTSDTPATSTVSLPGGGTQTDLSTLTQVLPAGSSSSLIPGPLSVDSSGTLWIPSFDQQDINTGSAANNALDSYDTTTGDYSRIVLGSTQILYATSSGSNFWGVTDANDVDTIDTTSYSGDVAADVGFPAVANQAYTGTLAEFASSNAGDFTYSIDYGNGTTGTGTITNDGTSDLFTIPANVTYAAAGNYNLTLTIVSANGDIATVHGVAIVTGSTPLVVQGVPAISGQKDIALTPNVVGQSTLVVAQFSGAPASYTASIDWGDGTPTTSGTIVSLGNNQYVVELAAGQTKTYAATGTFTISVSISDGTQTQVATSTANIVAVPVVASQNVVLKPLFGPVFLGTVATFTADPLATASWFKSTIHWGDGSTSTGIVVRTAAGTFQVIGLHIYKKGSYSVTTNIVDTVDSETATATATITITK